MAYESREYSSERDMKAIRRNSMSGESGKRTGEKKIKMTLSAYKARLKLLAITVAAVTSVALSCVPGAVKTVSDNWTVNKLMNEFHVTYVSPETHRTDDNEHYWYDYAAIADKLEDSENFDRDLFIMSQNSNYFDMNEVFKFVFPI